MLLAVFSQTYRLCIPSIARLSTLLFCSFYLLLASITSPVAADAFYGNIERFSVYEGLPEASVYSIANDQAGFLWLGTPSGLVRFDGYEFETYSDAIQNQVSLKSPDASNVFIDSKNRLWIGSWGQGLLVYQNDLTLIAHYRHDPDDPDDPTSLGSDLIQVIFEDSDGDIWIGTNGGGLTLFSQSGNNNNKTTASAKHSFTNFKNDPNQSTSLSHNRIWSIAQTPDGILWIGTSNGLNRFDKNQPGLFSLFEHIDKNQPKMSFIRALRADDKGQLWIGSKDSISVFDTNKNHHQPLFSTNHSINCITIDNTGGILVGTSQGFYRWNPFNHQLSALGETGTTVLLLDNDIRDIIIDKNDILWLSTRYSGLVKIKSTPNAFQTYSHFKTNGQTKPIGRVNVITQDSQGKIWLGTSTGLMTKSLDNGEITQFDAPPEMEGITISAIEEDKQGTLWVGALEGLYSLSINNPIWVNQNQLLDKVSDKGVSSLLFSAQNTLWIGTNHGGIIQFDGTKTVNFRHDQTDNNSLASNAVRMLVEDHQGDIWVGTNGGALSRFDIKKNHFINYHNDQNQPNSINGVVINAIHQTNQHTLWVGLQQSLDKLTTTTGVFEHFGINNGINSQSIKSINADDQGYLWLATSKGISRYDVQQRLFVNFTNKDGFDNNAFVAKAVTKTQDGNLYFGGNKGVTKVVPSRLNFNSQPAITAISKVWIDHQLVQQIAFDGRSKLRLPHDNKDLKFQFTLLDFKDPDKNRYSYRLKGYDNNWHQANKARTTNYTNLNPGNYSFEVKGSNSKGIWSNKPANIQIHIATPWWALLWVRTLFVLLLALMMFLLYRYRVFSLAKQNAELEAKVANRSSDLFNAKKQLIESQKHVALSSLVTGIAHEINTPVGIGVTAITMLQDLIESLLASHNNKSLKLSEFEAKLLNIQSSAGLVYNNLKKSAELINTFKKVSVDQMSEQCRVFDLSGYLHEIADGLQAQLTTKSITVTVNCPDKQLIDSYPGAVAQVVTNLILNAFTHGFDDLVKTDENREITIDTQSTDSNMTVTVCDNGKGIGAEQLSKIFDPFYTTKRNVGGSGLGLHISYNIVDRLLNGTINCTSTPGKGACFCFDISRGSVNINKGSSTD
jgi:ligand-binding sensor domain-containing protein/signal transduction histidine kinase